MRSSQHGLVSQSALRLNRSYDWSSSICYSGDGLKLESASTIRRGAYVRVRGGMSSKMAS